MQVGLLVAFVTLGHLLWFLDLPLMEQVQRISDDAFYYLVLARNHAESGAWTFDHLSTASGFHPLHAFFLAGISALDPSLSFSSVQWVAGLASVVILTIAATQTARILEDTVGGLSVFAVAALLTSPIILIQVTSLMESPWVILAGALCYRCVLASSRASLLSVALVGAFGSFARTDFGLLPLMMLFATAIVPRNTEVRRSLQLRIVVLLAGASLALGLFLLYVHGYSGSWLQSSTRMKSLWAESAGPDLRSYFRLLVAVLQAKSVLVFVAAVLLQLAIGVSARIRETILRSMASTRTAEAISGTGASRVAEPECAWIALSGGATVLAYILFYGTQNSATPQTWYSASFVVPLALGLGVGAGRTIALVKPPRSWQHILIAGIVGLGALTSLPESRFARFPHQVNILGAAWWLKAHPQDRRVGAFNAGLLAYFSETDIVNLDGLVNDDIFDYARRDALSDYLDDSGVGYILDYPGIWRDPTLQQRGGYSGGELAARLHLVHRIRPLQAEFPWLRGHPVLMKVDDRR